MIQIRTKRLIINADDFGWGRKLTDTIVQCHLQGIVTSTTLMVNMPAAQYAAKRASEVPELSVGVHLNLTEGPPICPHDAIPDLLDEHGNFPGNALQSARLWRGGQYFEEVRRELAAQIERCLDLGVVPTHCDSHHGIHKLPVVRRAMVEAMKEQLIKRARTPLSRHRMRGDTTLYSAVIPWLQHNLKRAPVLVLLHWGHLRLRQAGILTPQWKATRSMGLPSGSSPKEQLLACIAAIPSGCSEILLHPGDHGPEDQPSDWHLKTWAEDTPICLDTEVASFIDESGIELISFRSL
ncbi:MAG: ChbG/HpnK family deacetylase [Proteobacteria bacterium]|nr:ChbG/HpnK family deacetylase [Pseudomonadota bacterium]